MLPTWPLRTWRLLVFFTLALAQVACNKEDVDIAALTDFPPSVLEVFPADGGSVVSGDFDLSATLVDGVSSPLASGTLALYDSTGAELAAVTEGMSGTRDSITLPGAEFGAASLALGVYTVALTVTDIRGQSVERTTSFSVTDLPFAANQRQLFLAGEVNGWSSDSAQLYDGYAFTLVGPNTWELDGVRLDGGAFKLKNTVDWTDEDFGDPECDGVMNSSLSTAGNDDTDCGYTGLSRVSFDDATLTYTVEATSSAAQTLGGLYLLGEFDGASNLLGDGDEYAFSLTGDHVWELPEIRLTPGDRFKFAEMANFEGLNFGDDEPDGVAEAYGAAIAFEADAAGVYGLTFNDTTLAYAITFVREAGFGSIGILGPATPGGWDAETALSDEDGDGTYTLLVGLADGVAKFRADDDWAINWGGADFPQGTGTQDGAEIPVEAGLYTVSITPATGEYAFAKSSVGLLGDATPTGWDEDTDMEFDPANPNLLSQNVDLVDGEVKFRLDDDFAVNWGGTEFPAGTGVRDGENIPAVGGAYAVTFDVLTAGYTFTER